MINSKVQATSKKGMKLIERVNNGNHMNEMKV